MKRIEIVKSGMKWNLVKKFHMKAVQEISEDECEAEEDESFNEKKLESQHKITSHILPSSSRSSIKKYKPNNVKQKALFLVYDLLLLLKRTGYNYESSNQSYFS